MQGRGKGGGEWKKYGIKEEELEVEGRYGVRGREQPVSAKLENCQPGMCVPA